MNASFIDGKLRLSQKASWNEKLERARSFAAIALIAIVALGLGGCDKLKARDFLVKGVQAYKAGQTDAAIEDFKQARELDPNLLMAQVYLAVAYQGQFIPGAPSEENQRNGQQAIAEFQKVLQVDPNNLTAIDGMGSLLFSMAKTPYSPDKFMESKQYWQRHINVKPDDAEPYYWVGLIDWTLAYLDNNELRSQYNHANPKKQVHDEQALPASLRDEFSSKMMPTVTEGMEYLKKATERKPDYDDAMAYLALLDLQRADMATSQEERDSYTKQWSDLMEQVKQIKQKKAAAQPAT
jgi:tetratricopeptide (TPR) repeat protein